MNPNFRGSRQAAVILHQRKNISQIFPIFVKSTRTLFILPFFLPPSLPPLSHSRSHAHDTLSLFLSPYLSQGLPETKAAALAAGKRAGKIAEIAKDSGKKKAKKANAGAKNTACAPGGGYTKCRGGHDLLLMRSPHDEYLCDVCDRCLPFSADSANCTCSAASHSDYED
jgi:hypothetical protein